MELATVFNDIQDGAIIWVVLFLTATDVILGILHSLKKHHFKSAINKTGIINKCGIVISIVFFYVLDLILGLNNIGFSELFGATISLSELVSILYNLRSLDVPFPKTVVEFLDKYTKENKD